MRFNTRYWLKYSLLNLLIVASLGVILRFKIGFDFPYLDQRNMHHAHSHLAFTGWVTHTLFVLIINFLYHKSEIKYLKYYKVLLSFNLLAAYGMLVSFFIQGYGVFSIFFVILSIIVACFFTYFFFKDFKRLTGNYPSVIWFKAALTFNILSSIGTFSLIYMLTFHNFNENWYLASEYFYLHFQYNGFFIFSCLGLAINEFIRILPEYKYDKKVFTFFLASVIPAYFLSTLWANLPVWLYTIVIMAAILQLMAWALLIINLRKAFYSGGKPGKMLHYLFLFVGIAFSIKLLLQLGSTIPLISKLAYGFRHIVIAYLHLVLLAVVSGFLLTYLYSLKLFHDTNRTRIALIVFLIGVFLNELVLAIQGIASFSYFAISYVNEILLIITLLLCAGALMLLFSQRKQNENSEL